MQNWHQFPYIRILVPFLVGIVTAMSVNTRFNGIFLGMILLIALYFLLTFSFGYKLGYAFRWIPGLVINLFLILAGYQVTTLRTPALNPNDISHHNPLQGLVVEISEPVAEKENSYKVIAWCLFYADSDSLVPVSGKVLLYVEKDSLAAGLRYGDQLLVETTLQPVAAPANPGEFNYRRYLSNRGIYRQAYVKRGNWSILAREQGNPIKTQSLAWRDRLLEILATNGIRGAEYAVASAILLGYDEYLDKEQRRQFAGSGAMHILCVSGLHVGIIYVVLNTLLFFLQKRRSLRIIRGFLLLVLIWVYALITGLSPSVMRASTMFSFIILGSLLQRKINVYNSLAASAFLLLLIDPWMFLAVGFQLSYLAVVGIVSLHKPIHDLWIPDNWLLDKLWSLTVVSFSATLATFPLSIYYFHQFPLLFILTNYIAIPASALILYLGILVLITLPMPFISGIVSYGLVFIIRALNASVGWIEGLPHAVLRNIYITLPELVLLVVAIVALSVSLLNRQRKAFLLGFTCLFILAIFVTYRNLEHQQQNLVVVYHVRNHLALEAIRGRHQLLISDSVLTNDPAQAAFHIQNFRGMKGLHTLKAISVNLDEYQEGHFAWYHHRLLVGDRKIIVIDRVNEIPVSGIEKADVVVVSGNPNVKIADLLNRIEFGEMVFDSSNPTWRARSWAQECESLGISYHWVAEQGAWIRKF